MVSNLTQSWQKWVSEIKDKLAKEPISWAPDPLRELWGEPPKTPSTTKLGTCQKKVCPCQDPTAGHHTPAAQNNTSATKQESQDISKPGQTDSTGSSGEAMQRDSDGISPKGEVESWVRVKRPAQSTKELDDANRINALSKKYSAVGNLKSRWQNWSSTNTVNQKLNPFSEDFDYEYSMSLRLHKGEEGYGRPKEDTKTNSRTCHGEIADMCYVIRTMNDPDPDGKTHVTFRELFDRYVRVSDKVVGILLRVKRHGKVAFEGEMLWQGQDDGVIITLSV
ncbi:actin binding Rho activating protein b [Oncorhynchus keta]|uniref:actin binding Rho activating protein b n=1 Tax=Oncorhynchus keta TaxID=8018 RepID=UPI00227D375E|nr:actin binding Rho activating protein b [Oncorhynchus keta]